MEKTGTNLKLKETTTLKTKFADVAFGIGENYSFMWGAGILTGGEQERYLWYKHTKKVEQKWGTPIYIQLAIIKMESDFDWLAKPPRKKIFKVIKSSENNLIMSLKEGKNLDILKIAQRGNASLQKEYETLLKKMPDDIEWAKLSEYEEKDMTHGSQELACSAEGGCEIVDLVAV